MAPVKCVRRRRRKQRLIPKRLSEKSFSKLVSQKEIWNVNKVSQGRFLSEISAVGSGHDANVPKKRPLNLESIPQRAHRSTQGPRTSELLENSDHQDLCHWITSYSIAQFWEAPSQLASPLRTWSKLRAFLLSQ
jgi:hypothetical protein